MESGSIQLPFGFIPDQKTENDLQLIFHLTIKRICYSINFHLLRN